MTDEKKTGRCWVFQTKSIRLDREDLGRLRTIGPIKIPKASGMSGTHNLFPIVTAAKYGETVTVSNDKLMYPSFDGVPRGEVSADGILISDLLRDVPLEPAAQETPEPQPSPPLNAEFLLQMFVRREDREHVIGCMEEDFRTRVLPRYGYWRAIAWYWWEVTWTVLYYVWDHARRLVGFGLLAKAADWIFKSKGGG